MNICRVQYYYRKKDIIAAPVLSQEYLLTVILQYLQTYHTFYTEVATMKVISVSRTAKLYTETHPKINIVSFENVLSEKCSSNAHPDKI